MTTKEGKGNSSKMKYLLFAFLALVALYFTIQWIRCAGGLRRAQDRLKTYDAKSAELSYGTMTYIDEGEGEFVLSVHGIFGGYDQAYVLATSAGGTPAIRFALDYPERVKGLILFCSAMPVAEKPESFLEYQAPPEPLLSDYAMYLISPLMEAMMGMPASTVEGILPVADRKIGVVLDGKLTNPDMERNFEQYPIEDLQVPVLILHSEDDPVASFEKVRNARHRFPNLTLVSFPDGGHMMEGHGAEIDKALDDFLAEHQ